MYTLSVVLLGLFIVPWFLLLDTGTSWGIYAGDDRCLRHPVGAGDRGAGHPVLRDIQRQCALYRDHPRLPLAGRCVTGAPASLSPPVCWRNTMVTGDRWLYLA